MKIGVTGPISTESVAQFLEGDVSKLPKGMGGAPLLGTLIGTLIARGHEVSAYTLDWSLPPSSSEPVVACGRGFKIYYGPYRPHSFRWSGGHCGRMLDFFRVERRAIARAIQIDQPDVVHAHWTYEFALAAIASGVPHVVTCHDSPVQVLRFMPNLYRLGRYFMARRVFQVAKVLSAVSPYVQGDVAKFARVPVAVIPNPMPSFLSKPQISDESRIASLSQPRIAMILNGWTGLKNPEPALEAFSMLRQIIPGATLHLFGQDFDPGGKAEVWVKTHKIDTGIIFHGPTRHEQLLVMLGKMHLLLHPALVESCPMALVEAMALGLPVVGGDKSGGVPWVLDNGAAGVLVAVRSAKAIYQGMKEILENKSRYQSISCAGLARAQSLFTADAVADEYEKLYMETIRIGDDSAG